MRYSVRLMPARGTQGFRKYGRYRTVTEISGLRVIAFSSRCLPMKHHGQTTSDTTSIGSSVAAALAGAGIGLSSTFEEKIGRPVGKGNSALRVVELAICISGHDSRSSPPDPLRCRGGDK